MKVVAFISQKGGTAKTCAAINLAVAAHQAGLSVLVVDLDPQVSACDWRDLRQLEAGPLVEPVPVPHLQRRLLRAETEGVDLVVVDTAGRLAQAATESATYADLILIPVQPTTCDLKTLRHTMQLLKMLRPRKPTRALLTRVKAVGNRHEQSSLVLADMGNEVCPVMMGERVIYQDAYTQGLGVTEVDEPRADKAAEETRELLAYVLRTVGLAGTPDIQQAA